MLSRSIRSFATVVAIVFATAAMAQAMGPAKTTINDRGTILVGPNDRTLYTYDADTTANVTTCYGGCATAWPPFYVGDNAAMADADWTIVQRTDDQPMWAYKGKPLYYYQGDTGADQITGDGRGGVWHIVITEVPM